MPLNPLLSADEIAQRVADAGARLVDPESLDGPAVPAVADVDPDDTAVILYTSGTTGAPKRIELAHGRLRRNAEYLLLDGLGIGPHDVLFGSAPLAHVFGMTGCMNGAIAAGACLALVPRFDGVGALDTIERENVTVFMGVPAMCSALLAASDATGRAPPLRLAHVGGAPLPLETAHAFAERFGAVVLEGYGMTEVGGCVALQHAGRPRTPGSVGTPVADTELRLADDGELLVRAGGEWLATGDIGRFDAAGDLFLVDRKKDVILRGGYTVYPSEVENALCAHPHVREAVVVGVPHAELGEEVAALVVPAGPACSAEELKAFARERVAAYKYPRLVVLVDELPHGPTGKVQRREIDLAALARLLSP